MNTKKKLNLDDSITSTSDIKLGDIVEAVAKHLGCPRGKAAIEDAVRGLMGSKTVASIGGAGTVTPSVASVTVTREGDGLGVRLGVGAAPSCEAPVCDTLADGPVGCSPRYATSSKWFQKVLQNGEVWTPYTNRRFLPAQYLHLMHEFCGNMSAAVSRRYSLRDCFLLLDTEIEKLIWVAKHWKTAFSERSQFLTVSDCVAILTEYLTALRKNVNDRGLCSFAKQKKEYWRRIQGEGRVALWTYSKESEEGDNGAITVTESIEPTKWLIRVNAAIEISLRKLKTCRSYETALGILRTDMPKVSMGTFKDGEGNVRNWLPKRWKECFLKAGAYYTLKSLVVNGNVKYTTEEGDWRHKETLKFPDARDGLVRMGSLVSHDVPSFVVHAILKKSMAASGFDLGSFLCKISKR